MPKLIAILNNSAICIIILLKNVDVVAIIFMCTNLFVIFTKFNRKATVQCQNTVARKESIVIAVQ